jgi:nitronate monooxygenase
MAGGPSTPELAGAASAAGALGSLGSAYDSPRAIEEYAEKVRARTDRPFGINLFVPAREPKLDPARVSRALDATRVFRNELGLSDPEISPPYAENFGAQLEAVLRVRPAVFSFVFGLLDPDSLRALKAEKIFVVGTATSLEEAGLLEQSGVNAIVLQGIEAGGHRGIFDANAADPEISALDLLEACRGKLRVPLIAAGGIMSRNDIARALSKGAQAVQMGTAFLACKEAGTSAPYRKCLLQSPVRDTRTTRVFSGRLARGVINRFMTEMEKTPDALLPFPIQNVFTRDLRAAGVKAGSSQFLSLWAGTGKGELWTGSASELIAQLFD